MGFILHNQQVTIHCLMGFCIVESRYLYIIKYVKDSRTLDPRQIGPPTPNPRGCYNVRSTTDPNLLDESSMKLQYREG